MGQLYLNQGLIKVIQIPIKKIPRFIKDLHKPNKLIKYPIKSSPAQKEQPVNRKKYMHGTIKINLYPEIESYYLVPHKIFHFQQLPNQGGEGVT